VILRVTSILGGQKEDKGMMCSITHLYWKLRNSFKSRSIFHAQIQCNMKEEELDNAKNITLTKLLYNSKVFWGGIHCTLECDLHSGSHLNVP
jgi:hypothetical protein